jgi:hypothetical protein
VASRISFFSSTLLIHPFFSSSTRTDRQSKRPSIMSGPSRNHPLPLSLLLLLLPSIGVNGFCQSTTTPSHPHWARSSGIPVLSSSSTCLASSIAMTATTSHQQPLATHGDWQAFFDEDRYCLMYYFNTKTGDSQWEPPEEFPIPMLDSHAASPFTAASMFLEQAKQKNIFATTTTTTTTNFSAGNVVTAGAQKKQAPVKKHQQQLPTPVLTPVQHQQEQQQQEPDVAAVLFKAAFGFAASMAGKAAEAVVDHVKKQQQQQQQQEQQQHQKSVAVVAQKEQENKPWWLSFFHQEKPNQKAEEPIRSRRLETSSSSSSSSRKSHLDVIDLLSEVNLKLQPSQRTSLSPPGTMASSSSFHHQSSLHQASTNTAAKKQTTFWSAWHNNNHHHASEPTIPLVPPLQREQWLQEKLYADSLKRQENLRKSYRKVIENRSPTISLSALKRDHKKDWYQYLNDDVV